MLMLNLLLGVRALRRNPLQSLLTLLGVLIGVGAVVTVVTLGKATAISVQDQIAALGTDVLQIRPSQRGPRGESGIRPPPFKLADARAIAKQIPGIAHVAPLASVSLTAIHAGSNWTTTLNGTLADYFDVQPWPLDEGRTWTDAEDLSGRSVCVLGSTVREQLYTQRDPIGQRLRLGSNSCEIIGVLTARGHAGFGVNLDDMVLMPIKAVERRFSADRSVNLILVRIDPRFADTEVKTTIAALMRERRHMDGVKEDDFTILEARQLIASMEKTTAILTKLLSAVAAISLLIGCINIMNIMLVSVTERTREIGIRLAVGAFRRDVFLQFLIEAVVLSGFGGFIGLALAQICIAVLTLALGLPWAFDAPTNVGAFLVATAIGIISGYYPAWRAASFDPIDALRYE